MLKSVCARIRAEHPEVSSIRLFGSIATGEQVGTSDADILIILRGEEPGDPLEWIRSFYGYFRLPVPVDILVYNEAQVAKRLQCGDIQFERLVNQSIELL